MARKKAKDPAKYQVTFRVVSIVTKELHGAKMFDEAVDMAKWVHANESSKLVNLGAADWFDDEGVQLVSVSSTDGYETLV